MGARLESRAKEVLHERGAKSKKKYKIKEGTQQTRTDIPCLHTSLHTPHAHGGGNRGNNEGSFRLMTDRQQADRYTQTDRHFLLPEKVYVSDFYQKVGVDNRLKKAVLGVDARDLSVNRCSVYELRRSVVKLLLKGKGIRALYPCLRASNRVL